MNPRDAWTCATGFVGGPCGFIGEMSPRFSVVRAHGDGASVVIDAVVGLQDATISSLDVRFTGLEVIVKRARLAPSQTVVRGSADDGTRHRAVAVEMKNGALFVDE